MIPTTAVIIEARKSPVIHLCRPRSLRSLSKSIAPSWPVIAFTEGPSDERLERHAPAAALIAYSVQRTSIP